MRNILIALVLVPGLLLAGQDLSNDPRLDAGTAERLLSKQSQRLMVRFVASMGEKSRYGEQGYRGLAADVLDTAGRDTMRVIHRYHHIPAMVIETDAAGVARLLDDARVARIGIDAAGGGGLADSTALAGIDPLHVSGVRGAGTTVAVLDSGHDANHPDLVGRTLAQYCFCGDNGGCCPNGQVNQQGEGAADDDHGHGTHVSSIALGAGEVAASGVAPEANLVSVKVLDDDNRFCCSGDIVAGLDTILQHHPEVDVVNLSLGTDATFPNYCDQTASWTQSLSDAVNALHERGTLVTVSAMNQGQRDRLPVPACLANVITVGAVWARDAGRRTFTQGDFSCTEQAVADRLTCFSNTSEMLDIVAPGAPIRAAAPGGGAALRSGTSMSAPMVAGCLALMREVAPTANPEQMRESLSATATWVEEVATMRIFPRLDCQASIDHLLTLVTQPPLVDEGFSGAWYSPERNGEGWVLEMLDDGSAVMYWFTYDRSGEPLWLLGVGGRVEDDAIVFDELIRASGPQFGEDFDADDFQSERFGGLSLRFESCDNGVVEWQADDAIYGSGSAEITRLTFLGGVDCE